MKRPKRDADVSVTPQELLDRDGFIVFSSGTKRELGEVVMASGGMVPETVPMVVVGSLSEAEAQDIARRNGVHLCPKDFYYKVIVE